MCVSVTAIVSIHPDGQVRQVEEVEECEGAQVMPKLKVGVQVLGQEEQELRMALLEVDIEELAG